MAEIINKEIINKEILQLLKEIKILFNRQVVEVEFITNEEFRNIFKISTLTLIKWRNEGIIPYHKIGSKFYYKYSEIMEVFDKYRIPAKVV